MVVMEGPKISLSIALEHTDWAVHAGHLIAARVGARTGRSLGVAAGHGNGPCLLDRADPSHGLSSDIGRLSVGILSTPLAQYSAAGFLCAPEFLERRVGAVPMKKPYLFQPASVFGVGRLVGMFQDVGGEHLPAGRVGATTGRSRRVSAGHGSTPRPSTPFHLSAGIRSTTHWNWTEWLLNPTPLISLDSRASFPFRATKKRMHRSGAAQAQFCWIYRRHSSWHAVETLSGWVKHQINVLIQRLGLEPPLLLNDWSWIGVIGAPVVQFDNAGSCTLSACTTCTEAQHRLTYEREHGWGSFPCKARVPPNHLRQECLKRRVWEAVRGAWTEDIFKVIKAIEGIPTTKATKGVRLTIDNYEVFVMDSEPADLTSRGAAQLLYVKGPFVGVLWANDEYDECDGTRLYRGCPKTERNLTGKNQGLHAVVCFQFRMVGRELRIRIMDSYSPEGPLRWVLFEAFDCFILPRVNRALELPQ